jgi:hypothetical protein
MDPKKMKSVYSVVERNNKTYWRPLGIGFVNRDGSINLKLDTFPLWNGGKELVIQVRDYEPKEERGGADRRGDVGGRSAGLDHADALPSVFS